MEREAAALRDLHREDGHPEVMILFPDSQIILFPVSSRGMFLVAVALSSNHVLIYNDKNVVDCFKMDDTVSAMKFGRFGREENTLVLGKLCDRQETKYNLCVKDDLEEIRCNRLLYFQ